jgi:CheY-like chemotaxis protein
MNLALNARDAMPEGGAITIETQEAMLSEATARRHPYPLQAGPYVEISVRDTGYGMDEATLGHVFEPFFTTKDPGKGTGLGLSTVYGIVKQSGGFLRVESTSGEGATFRVYLPRVPAEPKHSAPTQRALPIANGETILVVEDEPAMRMVTRRLLENTGYRVLEAAGGEEALRMVSEHEGKIDLVLTDVVMPGISGAALAECLLASYPNLCVLYMSGYTDDQVIRHGLRHEQVHFLQKPFDAEQLGRRLREALGEG